MNNYTGEQRVVIAMQEYKDLKLNKPVTIDNGNTKIGYVSKVVNNQKTGEQAYVITDNKVLPEDSLSKRNQVQEITVLYRGSTAPSVGNIVNP